MDDESKVLLIDDGDESRQDVATVLNFLGEKTISTAPHNWHSLVCASTSNSSEIAVVIIAGTQKIPLHELIAEVHEWDKGLPFVLIGDIEMPDLMDEELLNRITARLSIPLKYQPFLDALHKARVYHDHYNRLRDFDGVRDYNMFRSLVGNSKGIQDVRQMMGQVANTNVSVLITGESGTGKEVVARNLHLNSDRADKPFVPINCGAIARELLESELFGHEKGAFTGAISARAGRFELADGGTLFLDEIGDMPLDMQVKLLRVIQERSFERVGGVKTIHIDVRILAATHKDLEAMIAKGEFRQDLYYRINVFPIEMPSLKDRVGDIPLLLNEIISIMEAAKRGSVRFNSSAIASLCQHPWPGNVRELANLVERMAILHPHGIVGVNDLPKKFRYVGDGKMIEDLATQVDLEKFSAPAALENSPVVNGANNSKAAQPLLPLNGLDLKEYLANLEKDLIEQALDDSNGVVARAADRLHVRRTTLVEKMRKYQLHKA